MQPAPHRPPSPRPPARANTAPNPSPPVANTCPPCSSMTRRMMLVVTLHCLGHLVGMPIPELSRTDDVGEQERDGPRRAEGLRRRPEGRPSRPPRWASSRRFATPSLRSSDETWLSIVRSETYSRAAISALVNRSPSASRTSTSRRLIPRSRSSVVVLRARQALCPSSRSRACAHDEDRARRQPGRCR